LRYNLIGKRFKRQVIAFQTPIMPQALFRPLFSSCSFKLKARYNMLAFKSLSFATLVFYKLPKVHPDALPKHPTRR